MNLFSLATGFSAVVLLVALVCAGVRIVRGPTSADRVVGLDLMGVLGVAAAGMAVVISGSSAFIDIALGVALVGFLSAVAFAAFIENGSISEGRKR
jgi:multicomponent Na+:H+ antiporter subunit F